MTARLESVKAVSSQKVGTVELGGLAQEMEQPREVILIQLMSVPVQF